MYYSTHATFIQIKLQANTQFFHENKYVEEKGMKIKALVTFLYGRK